MEKGGEVVYLGEYVERERQSEFAADIARRMTGNFQNFGLDSGFVPIVKQHLEDLMIIEDNDEKRADSYLDVRMVSFEEDQEWQRLLVLNTRDVDNRVRLLDSMLDTGKKFIFPTLAHTVEADVLAFDNGTKENLDEDETKPQATPITDIIPESDNRNNDDLTRTRQLCLVAIDWIIAEQSIVALSNSYYMQTRFGRYIKDFDGQGAYYNTQYALSAQYIQDHPGANAPTAENDLQDLKNGFGLTQLHESLIRKGLTSPKEADWVLTDLRRKHYETAYRSDDIKARVSELKPRNDVQEGFDKLAESFYPQPLDDDLPQ